MGGYRMWMRTCAAVLAVVCVTTSQAWAQAGTASLHGTIMDAQSAALPGVTVTATSLATAAVRTTVTDGSGSYQLLALPPGDYQVKFELSGFRTAVHDKVTLQVDLASKLDVPLEIGSLSETVNVTGEVAPINTTDASMGNVITGQQVRALPLEANNVVGLLSLQPGAVYIPNSAVTDARTGAVLNIDPRSGAVSGGRADQSNVTLDGIDVNDPQFGTAYNSSVRVTLDSLQEFRVSTSNYGADSGRSSGAQVSLVTRSGTNDFHGSANWVQRNTRFSSNDYFLKLSQLQAGEESKAPKLDKRIYGGSFGGPVAKDKLFFFGNYERLTEDSESPVLRNIPSLSMRDGVLVYPCANPAQCPGGTVNGFTDSHSVPAGHYGMTPGELASVDPLGIGPSRLASDYFKTYPEAERPRNRQPEPGRLSLCGARSRTRSTLTSAASTTGTRTATACSGGSTCRTIRLRACRSFRARRRTRRARSRAAASHSDGTRSSPPRWSTRSATASRQITRGHRRPGSRDVAGETSATSTPILAQTASSSRDIPTHTIVRRRVMGERGAYAEVRRQPPLQPRGQHQQLDSFHIPQRQRVVGRRRWHHVHARRTVPAAPRPRPATRCRPSTAACRRPTATRSSRSWASSRRSTRTTTTTSRERAAARRADCAGALRRTSTSSTRRTAGRSGRT